MCHQVMSCHVTSVRMLSFLKCYIWKVHRKSIKTNQSVRFGVVTLCQIPASYCLSSSLARTLLKRMGDVGNIFVREFAQHDVLCCDLNLFVVHASPRPRSTNFRVAKRSLFYFLQHESLLREEVVIHATNTQLTTRTTLVARQVARKCCLYDLAFKQRTESFHDDN